ncbi:MAG: hypothetical protein WCG27_11180, partial [Pseudomonadota bacterium]
PFTGAKTIELAFQDKVINSFSIPVDAVTFYGDFLVFIEPGSFITDTGVQNVSFVDLKTYTPALGREAELPIFRIPVQMKEPAKSISIRDGELLVNGTRLPEKVFAFFSQNMQMRPY